MKACVRATPPAAVAIGVELRAARLEANCGVRELARRLAVNPAHVSNWELGERVPPPDIVSFVAGVLQLTMTKFNRLSQLAADARCENHIEPQEDAAARLTAVYEQLASHIIEWAPVPLPDRRYADRKTPAHSGRAPAIRDLFVSARSCRNSELSRAAMIERNERLLRLRRQKRGRVRLVTADVGDLPAFTVYRIDGRTPTVALRHAGCSIYLTAELATADYIRATQSFAAEALSPEQTAETVEQTLQELKTGR